MKGRTSAGHVAPHGSRNWFQTSSVSTALLPSCRNESSLDRQILFSIHGIEILNFTFDAGGVVIKARSCNRRR
jgi:hypothetical protein